MAQPRGVAVSPSTLQFFQLDVNTPWESLPYVGLSGRLVPPDSGPH